MATNQAAWLKEAKQSFLHVDSANLPSPGPDEVVVENRAIAINPVDWKMQDYGFFIDKYPVILGTDVAGVIHKVGSNVKNFKEGDRVIHHANGLMTKKPEQNAFQLYTAGPALATAKIPSSLSFADAVVLPLALSTASAGLYPPSNLGLPHPQASSPKKSGKVVLIWGGASSVGSTAIQLAAASGVTVITTASQRNHSYVKDLGATTVIDYNNSSVVQDVLDAIKSAGGEFAGVYDSISEAASYKPVFEIVQKAGGSNKVITVLPAPEDKPSDVDTINIFAPIIFTPDVQAVGKAVWADFVPAALENGSLRALPKAEVVGKGLESLQEAMNIQKKGVSAKKIVIEL